MPGCFITFEGTEGCGKSTQAGRLAQRLRSRGYPVIVLREPGGTAIGEEIRHTLKHSLGNRAMTPETELLLVNASRAQLVREVIRPALLQGRIVVCDRFADSTLAYQGYGRGIDLDLVRSITDFAVGPTRPNLTLWLNLELHASEARRTQRDTESPTRWDRFEANDRAFFERVGEGYTAIARGEPQRVREIDGALPVEEAASRIWQAVKSFLPPPPQFVA